MQNPHLSWIFGFITGIHPQKFQLRVLLKQMYMEQLVLYFYAVRVRILGNVALRRVSLQRALKTFDVSLPTHPPIYPIFHNVYP